jgi:hypothetical protein
VSAYKAQRLAEVTRKSLQQPQKPDSNHAQKPVNDSALPELKMAEMLGHRIRYFSDGAVIGSKVFVNEAFALAREKFSAHRKDGARKMRGAAEAAAGILWSARDLRLKVAMAQN